MLDDIAVLGMIAAGEGLTIEFKRELDLSVAKNKAEFIKDIIALANSATETAFMLVGVDNDKLVRGIDKLEEEALQQIAHAYITPSVRLNCQVIPLSTPHALVGAIEVTPSIKPHKVARSIENIQQHRVYVRHGTVVAEATPEEVYTMYGEGLDSPKSRRYAKAGRAHAEVGNYESAVAAYSEAIEIAPTSSLFLARAMAYEEMADSSGWPERRHWTQASFDDYTKALRLTRSPESIKEIRRNRWRVYWDGDAPSSSLDQYEEEYKWLRENLTGRDLGEAVFIHVQDNSKNLGIAVVATAVNDLTYAIDLGYREAHVFARRAEAHFHASNFGLALDDIDTAIQKSDTQRQPLEHFYYLKADILASMRSSRGNENGQFKLALVAIQKAISLGGNRDPFGYIGSALREEVVYKIALRFIANGGAGVFASHKWILRQILLWPFRYESIALEFPEIVGAIRQIVGEDFWQTNKAKLE